MIRLLQMADCFLQAPSISEAQYITQQAAETWQSGNSRRHAMITVEEIAASERIQHAADVC